MKRNCDNCYKTKMENKSQACPCRDCKRRPGLMDYHATPEERAKVQDMRGYYG